MEPVFQDLERQRSKGNRGLEPGFTRAVQILERLNSGELFALGQEYAMLHAECLKMFAATQTKIDQHNVFDNGDIGDVHTVDIKYMNCFFYIANCLERAPVNSATTSVHSRLTIIELAIRKYGDFFALMYKYDQLESTDYAQALKMLDLYCKNEGPKLRKSLNGSPERKGKVLKDKKLHHHKQQFDDTMKKLIHSADKPDEKIRDAEIRRLDYHIVAAWKSLEALDDEHSLLCHASDELDPSLIADRTSSYVPTAELADFVLNHVPRMGQTTLAALAEDLRIKRAKKKEDFSRKVEAEIQIKDRKLVGPGGKIIQPFTIVPDMTAKRAQLKKAVYGTGQYLPTVSIEELVTKELANQVKPTIPTAELATEDEDRDYIQDLRTLKDRNWDEFVENNPRGSGNTMNMG